MFKASIAYVKKFISIACLREKVFFLEKVSKSHFCLKNVV